MSLLDHRGNPITDEQRSWSVDTFTYNGNTYPIHGGNGRGIQPTMAAGRPSLSGNLESIAEAVQSHSVISGAVLARQLLISQIHFQWRDEDTEDLFARRNHPSLKPLRKRSGARNIQRTLRQAESHVSYAGNAYIYLSGKTGNLRCLRPDYVKLILGTDQSEEAIAKAIEEQTALPAEYHQEMLQHTLDAEVIGYIYHPPGLPPEIIEPGSIAHWAPEAHPTNDWIGASWISSVFREFLAYEQADQFMDKFFQNGATPRLIYKMDPTLTPEEVEEFKLISEAKNAGVLNSHRSMYLGGASDVQVVGSDTGDIDLKKIHGSLETRMAMRSRVPAVILGIAEGMQGSALNSGNYGQTRRVWNEGWFSPTADGLAATLEPLLARPPRGGYLSWDPEKILFLQEDLMDSAEVFALRAQAIRSLTDGGYEPESVTAAAKKFNPELLKHTGLLPVQVQPPGATADSPKGDANDDPLKKRKDKRKYKKAVDEAAAKLAAEATEKDS